jgi:hypothetical protein
LYSALLYQSFFPLTDFTIKRKTIKWDFRFSRWQVWRWLSSDDGGSKHLWYISKLLPDYIVHLTKRQPYSLLWEPQISTVYFPCFSFWFLN